MTTSKADAPARARHLVVVPSQHGRTVSCRVLDLATEYAPLMKELGLRALAGRPDLAGRPWEPHLRLTAIDTPDPRVTIEVHLTDVPAGGPLFALDVPVANFQWIAADLVRRFGDEGDYSYRVAVAGPGSEVLARWRRAIGDDDDLEFIDDSQSLHLPRGLAAGPPPAPRRVVRSVPASYLRCVFGRAPLAGFLRAAAGATDTERSWLGLGRAHLHDGRCYVVVEDLAPLPAAEAGADYIITHGRDWARLHARAGGRLVAYLHLHPRTVEGRRITPRPSGNDAVVAWNVDHASPDGPCAFPIALFGTDPDDPGGDLAVHAYDHGLLQPAQLEEGP